MGSLSDVHEITAATAALVSTPSTLSLRLMGLNCAAGKKVGGGWFAGDEEAMRGREGGGRKFGAEMTNLP